MTNKLNTKQNIKPNITLTELDADRLDALLSTLPARNMPGRDALAAELLRADIVPSREVPPDVVTMHSTVRFSIAPANETQSLTLVFPREVGDGNGTVSVLAPVGSALLGLSEGDEIDWPGPSGGTLRVRIDKVVYQPERAGDFAR